MPSRTLSKVSRVEVAVMCVGSETRKNTVGLGAAGVKVRKTLLPACGVGWNWCPRGSLVRRVAGRCQRANRSGVNVDDAWQVADLIWSFFHREHRRNAYRELRLGYISKPTITSHSKNTTAIKE